MEKPPFITTIAKTGLGNPRNDTASIAALKDGSLMVVWHEYKESPAGEATSDAHKYRRW